VPNEITAHQGAVEAFAGCRLMDVAARATPTANINRVIAASIFQQRGFAPVRLWSNRRTRQYWRGHRMQQLP